MQEERRARRIDFDEEDLEDVDLSSTPQVGGVVKVEEEEEVGEIKLEDLTEAVEDDISTTEKAVVVQESKNWKEILLWLVLTIISQLGWGLYPTYGRYLQTQCHLPSISIVATENIVAIIYSFFHIMIRGDEFIGAKTYFMWLLMFTLSIRRITNTYATKFTSAINVQTISLLIPFVVSGLSFILLRDKLPDMIFPSIIISTIGALTVLLGGHTDVLALFSSKGEDFYHYISGVALTCTSVLFFSLGFLIIKKLASKKVGAEDILFWSCFPPGIVYVCVSLSLQEDWGAYLRLSGGQWFSFGVYVFVTTFLSFYIQAAAVQRLGAPMVSSFMPTRIVSTTLSTLYLLDESITWLQLLGMFIIFGCLSCYLTFQAAGGWKRDYRKLYGDIKSRVVQFRN